MRIHAGLSPAAEIQQNLFDAAGTGPAAAGLGAAALGARGRPDAPEVIFRRRSR